MPATTFTDFRDQVLPHAFYRVDAREWTGDWTDQWVAFADLIGFASVCERSPETATNVLVRFHRCLSRAHGGEPTVRAFRFTDAAYFVSPELLPLLRITSTLQHLCLAVNSHLLDRPRVKGEHLIITRITIARGSVLMKGAEEADDGTGRLFEVDSTTLLAGEGIVAAYKAEKRSAGFLTSFATDPTPFVIAGNVRGNYTAARKVLQDWVEDPSKMAHDNVWDFPWVLLRPVAPGDGLLWADDKASVLVKLEELARVWDLNFGSYVSTVQPIDTVKHFGAVQRHLSLLVQLLSGHSTIKRWPASKIRERIAAMQP